MSTSTKPLSQREINRRIFVGGIAPNYMLHTYGFGGLPHSIDLTNASVGFAMQRALREVAAEKPHLFP